MTNKFKTNLRRNTRIQKNKDHWRQSIGTNSSKPSWYHNINYMGSRVNRIPASDEIGHNLHSRRLLSSNAIRQPTIKTKPRNLKSVFILTINNRVGLNKQNRGSKVCAITMELHIQGDFEQRIRIRQINT